MLIPIGIAVAGLFPATLIAPEVLMVLYALISGGLLFLALATLMFMPELSRKPRWIVFMLAVAMVAVFIYHQPVLGWTGYPHR